MSKKRVLVAPLNWGLGHASRCMPIIAQLLDAQVEVVLAADGQALSFLKKTFSNLEIHQFPDIQIEYPSGNSFLFHMAKQLPAMQKQLKRDQEYILDFVDKHKIDAIISDNRYGFNHPHLPSIIISHQINLRAGVFSLVLKSYLKALIQEFNSCWIPDFEGEYNLSGSLSHGKKLAFNHRYIGALSAMEKENTEEDIDLLVLLSGPEPSRSELENIICRQLMDFDKKVVIIRGLPEGDGKSLPLPDNIQQFDFINPKEVERWMNRAKVVICRSGYSSIMDLQTLGKKAILVPTPGQSEQEYLAKIHGRNGNILSAEQDQLNLNVDWNLALQKEGCQARENRLLKPVINEFVASITRYE